MNILGTGETQRALLKTLLMMLIAVTAFAAPSPPALSHGPTTQPQVPSPTVIEERFALDKPIHLSAKRTHKYQVLPVSALFSERDGVLYAAVSFVVYGDPQQLRKQTVHLRIRLLDDHDQRIVEQRIHVPLSEFPPAQIGTFYLGVTSGFTAVTFPKADVAEVSRFTLRLSAD